MKRLIAGAACMVVGLAMPVAAVAGLSPTTCAKLAAEAHPDTEVEGVELLKRRDSVVFNHTDGTLEWPNPAKLLVRDGDIFVIVFKDTDSTLFDYSISMIGLDLVSKGVDLKANSESVETTRGDNVCVSWRFDKAFPLYRVSITRRVPAAVVVKESTQEALEEIRKGQESLFNTPAGSVLMDVSAQIQSADPPSAEDFREFRLEVEALPDDETTNVALDSIDRARKALQPRFLFPYTFPVWIEDSSSKLSFGTGFGFSEVVSDKFFLSKDNKGTPDDPKDDIETVEEDSGEKDAFRPDLMAFATFTAPRRWGGKLGETWYSGRAGLTVGVGIGNDAEPRYFFGPSFLLGRQFLMTVGAFGGKVSRLPSGQKLGDPPINGANTLTQLGSRFETGVGLGLAWSFGSNAGEDKFKAVLGLGAAQRVDEPSVAKPGKVADLKFDSEECRLTWAKPGSGGEPADYVIYESGKEAAIGTTKELAFTFTSEVKAGAEFQVAAKNTVGEGDKSDKAKAENGCNVPKPGQVTDLKFDSGECQLNWKAPSGAVSSYAVYEVGKDGAVGATIERAFTFTREVKQGAEFQVAAKNASGEGEKSDKAKAEKGCNSPGKVTNLKFDSAKCQLTWKKPAGEGTVSGYVVYQVGRDEAIGAPTGPVFKFNADVKKGTEFQVAGKNTSGEGEKSDNAKADKDCKPAP